MSTPPNRLQEHARQWINSARDDREALRLLEAAGLPRVVAFHAQQAVEKLLKGLLVSYDVDPEDTHVVGALVAQVHRLDRRLAERLGPVDRLTPYAVMTRYPARSGRAERSLDLARVAADVATARAACNALDEAIAARLAALAAETG